MDQYTIPQKEKEQIFKKLITDLLENNYKSNKNIKNFYEANQFNPKAFDNLRDIPPIPVNLFKSYDLKTCDEKDISRVLNSSSTTTGIPSVIVLDKTTSNRQVKGLISILKSIIGKKRRPYLVFDTSNVNKSSASTLTGRGAAIRGLANFASITQYVMKSNEDGSLELDVKKLKDFCEKYKEQDILAFGFTYIIWTQLVQKLNKLKLTFDLPKIKIFHSGGWKKLESKKVDKSYFNDNLASLFNTSSSNIIDFYGMVEQVGIIFPDCENGYKHPPNFGDIIIRDIYTLNEVKPGEKGLIQTLSLLPTSYAGQALLTEDMGELIGIDNCPCGQKGKYFVFRSRAEKAEIRGCGDTFAERMVKLAKEN